VLVLLGGQAEEEQPADPGAARPFGDPRDVPNRKTRVSGKRGDLGRRGDVRVDEDRQDEHRRVEPGLGDEIADPLLAA